MLGDIFEGVFNAGKWDLKPASLPGSGNLWCLPLGFELVLSCLQQEIL